MNGRTHTPTHTYTHIHTHIHTHTHTHTHTHKHTHTREHYFADLVQIQGKFFLQSVKVNNATLRTLIAERNELQGSYFFEWNCLLLFSFFRFFHFDL